MSLSSGELTYVSKQSSSCPSPVFEIYHSAADMTTSQSVCSSKPGQTGFRKVTSIGEPSPCPIPGIGSGVLEMCVKEGTKIRNLLHFAISYLQGEEHVAPVSQAMFTGLGRGITKTITCAEIVKHKVQGFVSSIKCQSFSTGPFRRCGRTRRAKG